MEINKDKKIYILGLSGIILFLIPILITVIIPTQDSNTFDITMATIWFLGVTLIILSIGFALQGRGRNFYNALLLLFFPIGEIIVLYFFFTAKSPRRKLYDTIVTLIIIVFSILLIIAINLPRIKLD
jgi:hypothetical protein